MAQKIGKVRTEIMKKQFVMEFPQNKFNISKTCKVVGISRLTYYDWLRDDPAFALAIEEQKQSIIDQYEQDLMEQSHLGMTTATIFALKTLGAERGYGEKNENINLNLGEIKIEIVKKDAPTN